MTCDIAKIAELYDAPETASLAILDAALRQTTTVLVYAHPELTSAEALLDVKNPEPTVWIADSLIQQARALSQTVKRYREAVALRRQWATVPTSDGDVPF